MRAYLKRCKGHKRYWECEKCIQKGEQIVVKEIVKNLAVVPTLSTKKQRTAEKSDDERERGGGSQQYHDRKKKKRVVELKKKTIFNCGK